MSQDQPASDPRYPIGPSPRRTAADPGELRSAVQDLAELPEHLRNAVDGLSDEQLGTPYRDGGWTVRQVVHHVADSHMNAFIRMRKALTEDNPVISTYDEAAWAGLADAKAPVEWSLELIESLHARWVMMLQALGETQWQRTFVHPDNGPQTVELATLTYAWHGRHHVAHITHLRAAREW